MVSGYTKVSWWLESSATFSSRNHLRSPYRCIRDLTFEKHLVRCLTSIRANLSRIEPRGPFHWTWMPSDHMPADGCLAAVRRIRLNRQEGCRTRDSHLDHHLKLNISCFLSYLKQVGRLVEGCFFVFFCLNHIHFFCIHYVS